MTWPPTPSATSTLARPWAAISRRASTSSLSWYSKLDRRTRERPPRAGLPGPADPEHVALEAGDVAVRAPASARAPRPRAPGSRDRSTRPWTPGCTTTFRPETSAISRKTSCRSPSWKSRLTGVPEHGHRPNGTPGQKTRTTGRSGTRRSTSSVTCSYTCRPALLVGQRARPRPRAGSEGPRGPSRSCGRPPRRRDALPRGIARVAPRDAQPHERLPALRASWPVRAGDRRRTPPPRRPGGRGPTPACPARAPSAGLLGARGDRGQHERDRPTPGSSSSLSSRGPAARARRTR